MPLHRIRALLAGALATLALGMALPAHAQWKSTERITYLIGPDGRVARRWDTVKVDRHAAEVLAAVEAIAG